jgi:hypothetical protein
MLNFDPKGKKMIQAAQIARNPCEVKPEND